MKTKSKQWKDDAPPNWFCEKCWHRGSSSIREIAAKQHADQIKAEQFRGDYVNVSANDHEPQIIMRDDLTHIEFEGLIGEKRALDFEQAPPIQIS